MKINLSPVFSEEVITLTKEGKTLKVNGEVFDFSFMTAGDVLPASAISSSFFVDEVRLVGTSLELTIILPIPLDATQEQMFPAPLLSVPDGPVKLPEGPVRAVTQTFPTAEELNALRDPEAKDA